MVQDNFDKSQIIDLDECVINALRLFIEKGVPELEIDVFNKPLVVGSGNSAVTGRIIFEGRDAVFADEGTYKKKLDAVEDIDGALLISASGGKHAPVIAKDVKSEGKKVHLLTCNEEAPAKKHADKTFVSPKAREPYTYNTSTYMGMILSHTKENPEKVMEFIREEVDSRIPPDFFDYKAFYIIVPTEFENVRELFMTKFDELFGPRINGRVFTPEQTKHAKTVVPWDKELFISFGYDNQDFGPEGNRLNIPLPEDAGPAALMAIGYYVIGHIQKQNPSYFKDNIKRYTDEASELFGQDIEPIVD